MITMPGQSHGVSDVSHYQATSGVFTVAAEVMATFQTVWRPDRWTQEERLVSTGSSDGLQWIDIFGPPARTTFATVL
jgi:hypothetical protein